MEDQIEMEFPGEDKREPQCKDCTDVPMWYEGCFCRDGHWWDDRKDKKGELNG